MQGLEQMVRLRGGIHAIGKINVLQRVVTWYVTTFSTFHKNSPKDTVRAAKLSNITYNNTGRTFVMQHLGTVNPDFHASKSPERPNTPLSLSIPNSWTRKISSGPDQP